MSVVDWVILALAALACVPVAVWVFEVVLALIGPPLPPIGVASPSPAASGRDRAANADAATPPRPRFAVVVPAHNEQLGIAATLGSLKPELRPGDRLVVVADNCNDRTADIAREHGVEVVERAHPTDRGKSFALGFGVEHIKATTAHPDDLPDALMIVDADCLIAPGSLAALADDAVRHRRPMQAIYTMTCPPNASAKAAISALSLIFKNLVRPLGLYRVGLPCGLYGTGMAIPWPLLEHIRFATGEIVEDMVMAVDLAMRGHPPRLCPRALVHAPIAEGAGMATQRTRWEHGHLNTLITLAPRLIAAGLGRGRPSLLALGIDLAVPPLSIVVFLALAALLVSGANLALGGSPTPALVALAGLLAMSLALLLGYLRFARHDLPLSAILAVPGYLLFKVPIYLRFLYRRETNWKRTERE